MAHERVRVAGVTAVALACLVFLAVPAVAQGTEVNGDVAEATVPEAEVSQAATPAVTVTPNEDLSHGDTVTAVGGGYTPNALIGITQCRTDAVDAAGCDLGTTVTILVDASGAWSTPFTVRRILGIGGSTFDCNTPPGCLLGAGDIASSGAAESASAAIEFADEPLPPPPAITVDPSGVLTHLQRVRVTGSGFAPSLPLSLRQCLATTGECNFVSRVAVADATGSFTIDDFIVQRVVGTHAAEITDCLDQLCVVRVQGFGPPSTADAPLSFADVPLPPTPQVIVDPSTGLAELQSVSVSGNGFGAGLRVNVVQCTTESTFFVFSCIFGPIVTTDDGGSFETTMSVARYISGFAGSIDCAQRGRCVVAAFSYDDVLSSTGVPIEFSAEPSPPPIPSPAVRGSREESGGRSPSATLPVTGADSTWPLRLGLAALTIGAVLVALAHAIRRGAFR